LTGYLLFKLGHLLCFVYWLGSDIGVFYSSRYVCDPSLGREARATAARIMGWVDMIPRYSLVLLLPFGLTLAVRGGWWDGPGSLVPFAWIGAVLWLALVWKVMRSAQRPAGKRLKQIDYVVRIGVIAWLASTGISGLAGHGPVQQPWLAAKLVVFALAVASGLAIRVLAAPFGPAFAAAMSQGPTPELELAMRRAMARAKPVVVLIWIWLLAAAWLGLAKPSF